MNLQEYLLTCLAEEAVELATELLRLQDNPAAGTFSTGLNKELCGSFKAEFNDVRACHYLLENHNVFHRFSINRGYVNERATAIGLTIASKNFVDVVFVLNEIQKAASKMLRFGVDHIHPVKNIAGKTVLLDRIMELYAWVYAIERTLPEPEDFVDPDAIVMKTAKVMRYATIHLENIEKEST